VNNLKVIEEFNRIKSIPYHISTHGEPSFDCEDKAKKFIEKAMELDYEARIRVGLFEWSILPLPKSIMDINHNKSCSHMFVEFKNKAGEWVFLDPTWNPELISAGFRITEWDGSGSTELGIPCYRILSPEEGNVYLKNIDYEKDIKENGIFYHAINEYCDSFIK